MGVAIIKTTTTQMGYGKYIFAITATANFGTDSVTLVATEIERNYDLSFTGILEYEYKDNNLSGSITNGSDLSGEAQA